MLSVNRVSSMVNKIIPRTLKGKVIASTATALVAAGSVLCCSRAVSNDEYAKAEITYFDNNSKNEPVNYVSIENGCGFQNDSCNYVAKDGRLYVYNVKEDKWEKTNHIVTSTSQMDIFEKISGMNKEDNGTLVLSKKDIKDAQTKKPKEICESAHAVSSGFRDVMVFHEDNDGSENQLVFSFDQEIK